MSERQRMDLADRFWSHVDKDGPVIRPELGPCWVYLTNGEPKTRGLIRVNGVQIVAARLSWELSYGRIPGSLHVLHECDHEPCIRPSHLFLGTAADNMIDKQIKGRGLRTLSLDQRSELRRLYENEQIPCSVLAERFGICLSNAYYIAQGVHSRTDRIGKEQARRRREMARVPA